MSDDGFDSNIEFDEESDLKSVSRKNSDYTINESNF